jgi:hypothetical protein
VERVKHRSDGAAHRLPHRKRDDRAQGDNGLGRGHRRSWRRPFVPHHGSNTTDKGASPSPAEQTGKAGQAGGGGERGREGRDLLRWRRGKASSAPRSVLNTSGGRGGRGLEALGEHLL